VWAFDWTSVHLAGAFLIGALFATVATLRVVRYVTGYFGGVRRARRGDDDDGVSGPS
jgi:hypothetical protein